MIFGCSELIGKQNSPSTLFVTKAQCLLRITLEVTLTCWDTVLASIAEQKEDNRSDVWQSASICLLFETFAAAPSMNNFAQQNGEKYYRGIALIRAWLYNHSWCETKRKQCFSWCCCFSFWILEQICTIPDRRTHSWKFV